MSGGGAVEKGMKLATYRRPFTVGGAACEATCESRMSGLHSELFVNSVKVSEDHTPATGEDAIRNHRLVASLPAGTSIEVELGYINWLTVGIAVSREGVLLHESHPGRRIAYPERAARMAVAQGGAAEGVDLGQFKRNRIPIAVDIALGLLFFIVAKATDLSTAAIVGAVVGLGLLVVQRFVKVDLIGGLALFGVVMLLLSAGLAILFQDDMAVKMRGTILGLISATLFLGDGLFGGNRLGKGLARYLPYTDIDPGRLAIGMGVLGLVMAGLNLLVARLASTDFWLFYSTFVDFALIMVLILFVFRYARGRPVLGSGRAKG
jgi:intracellular septation protein A